MGVKTFEVAEDAVNRTIDEQTSGHLMRLVEVAEDAIRRGMDE